MIIWFTVLRIGEFISFDIVKYIKETTSIVTSVGMTFIASLVWYLKIRISSRGTSNVIISESTPNIPVL